MIGTAVIPDTRFANVVAVAMVVVACIVNTMLRPARTIGDRASELYPKVLRYELPISSAFASIDMRLPAECMDVHNPPPQRRVAGDVVADVCDALETGERSFAEEAGLFDVCGFRQLEDVDPQELNVESVGEDVEFDEA